MAKSLTDPISPWFYLCEELGDFIGIRFGRIPPERSEPEWMFVRHTEADGLGGFALLLRQRGAEVRPLAQIRHPSRPSWFALLRALPKFSKPRRRVKWGPVERGPDLPSSATEPPRAVAWHVFDEPATTQIRRVCRKLGITVNSFLLKHLTKAIRPHLQDQSVAMPWMIPINLRGKVTRERDTDNYTSYVSVKVCSYETIYDIHHQIYANLGRGEHWANWYAYKASHFLPRAAKKYLLANQLAMSQWNIGSFSNLGDWDPDKTIRQPDCQGDWLFAPPVLHCQWLGTGCVTFQNRLSLTIQAHPDLTNSSAVPQTWVQNWVKEIQIDVTSALTAKVNMSG